MIRVGILRRPIEFLANCVAAIFGTALFQAEPSNLFHPRTLGGIYLKGILLSATIASLLGGFVFYRWKFATSKWIWIAGICGFAFHAIFLRGLAPPQRGYILSVVLDLMSVRMVSYSIGAVCVSLMLADVGSAKTEQSTPP